MTGLFTLIGIVAAAIPFTLGVVLLVTMWRAWWLYPAWSWFIVPLGLPQISFWHFTALLLIMSMLNSSNEGKKDERPTDWVKMFVLFILPIAAWALLRWMYS